MRSESSIHFTFILKILEIFSVGNIGVCVAVFWKSTPSDTTTETTKKVQKPSSFNCNALFNSIMHLQQFSHFLKNKSLQFQLRCVRAFNPHHT